MARALLAKRLERGRFIWPQAASGSVALTQALLSMLLKGIDWCRPERTWCPTIRLVNVARLAQTRRMLSSTDLPNALDAVKALLRASERLVCERDATIASQDDVLPNMQAQLTTRGAEIAHLKLQIAKLRRM